MAGPLDRLDQDPLVPGAGSGDPLGDDPSLLGNEPLQPFIVIVFDVHFIALAESADAHLANHQRYK